MRPPRPDQPSFLVVEAQAPLLAGSSRGLTPGSHQTLHPPPARTREKAHREVSTVLVSLLYVPMPCVGPMARWGRTLGESVLCTFPFSWVGY